MTLSSREPFLLDPALKDYLWGGERLKHEYGKDADITPVAESWECSTHSHGESVVASGEYAGKPLSELIERFPDMLGDHGGRIMDGQLPILFKLIDATDRLSIQVHPDDMYAYINEGGQYGKTECWYVLDAEEDAFIIYGFSHDMDKGKFVKKLIQSIDHPEKSNNVEKYFQKIKAKKDDIFFIPPGTVHAIGKGLLIAEVQENSDLTYRLYDYNRQDKDGKTRELHIGKALEVMNFGASIAVRQPMRVRRFYRGYSYELLARCKYFELGRMCLNTDDEHPPVISAGANSFRIMTCVEGKALLTWEGGSLELVKGKTVFIPAESIQISLIGKGVFLDASC